jgi:high-affinity iron transporter
VITTFIFILNLARLAGLCDYVAADYPGAVKDGKVIAADEYAEQKAMLGEARTMAESLTPTPGHEAARAPLLADIAKLAQLFDDKAPEAQLVERSRAIRTRLIEDYGLVLSPPATPSLERARSLYTVACATCHGEDGRAKTRKAEELKPPPVSFFDEERMPRVSPSLAFHAISFGISGTGMAAFDTLPASDRWSLAYYVLSMRHASADVTRGEELFNKSGVTVTPSAAGLAQKTDSELGTDPVVVAWLRRVASFRETPGRMFDHARKLLAAVDAAADDPDQARLAVIVAYLDGVEPHEAALRARDPAMTDRIERAFGALRSTIEKNAPASEIRAEIKRVSLVLTDAEAVRGKKSVPFLAAFAIALREGFELSLLIAALLAFVRKSGRGELARYIHLGWAAAVPVGLATWFVIGAALSGARRELTEGILTLVAAAMLLFVSHFVLGRMESRKWLKFLERRTKGAAPWPLVGVAFVAAYREAIEIVLFFRALALDSPEGKWAIVAGAASGVAVLVLLVQVMSYFGKRLNPRPVMLVSSILLTAIAISLVGQGVRALQEGGYVHVQPVSQAIRVPVLGIFPSVEGLVSQFVVLLLVLIPTWLEKRKARVTAPAG